jgi:hypothetical protein
LASRHVFDFPPTWKDRHFQKDFKALPGRRQLDILKTLKALISAVESSRHPATDPLLRQTYKVKVYSGVVVLKGATILEYSIGPIERVIAKYPARGQGGDVLFLAITLSHDHPRIKRLIKEHRAAIDNWQEEEPEE